ncbi:transmembrane transporter Liz1p [Fusarium subglutinans]|uniref:Transmembrane transporter Liz1p n=2 Tax=Fusarium fujikuroi species complex TaxID=171627 RepID=A0A8H5P8J3_GIBSU|nr:transmembrane transporter Liz1p [Fusarium subglutinans]KAF5592004.1 transmembrane transporter Liz1p [Fusarium subglutinans]
MPSTKSIAVVATLAASVTASNCKPTPKPTTTTSAPTTTSSCPAYTLISEPAEDINCNVRGDPKEGQSQVLESLYLDDCAQKCKEFDLFNCELISFVEPASAEEQGSLLDYLWGDTSKEERRLIRKLDFFILYPWRSSDVGVTDRQAFANAYVAGLKEALNLSGNQYNVLLSMASAGMLVGQIPSSIIIHKIRPRIWMSSMVVVWAGLTMASAACKTYAQLCAVRFLMGLAEASTYAGSIYIMGSWYKSNEIAKRTAMFTVAGQVGKMFAGAMMAAIHESMEGHAGLEGWQWVFLIDGIITLPVAVFGFFFFPDVPEYTDASYLSDKERQLALDRLPPKKEDGHDIQAWSLVKRVMGHPLLYVCCIFSVLGSALQSYVVQGLMLLYLKFRKDIDGFTQSEVNTLPIPTHAVGIVAELSVSFFMDRIVLLIPGTSVAGNLTALYLSASAYGINPLLYGWSSNILARTADDAARSVTLASMAASDGLLWTFWGIVMFPADHAPYWRNGYIGMLCVSAAMVGWLFVVRWLDRYTAEKYPAGDHSSASSLVATEEEEKGQYRISWGYRADEEEKETEPGRR